MGLRKTRRGNRGIKSEPAITPKGSLITFTMHSFDTVRALSRGSRVQSFCLPTNYVPGQISVLYASSGRQWTLRAATFKHLQSTPTQRLPHARYLAVLSLASLARLLVDRDPVLAHATDLICVAEGPTMQGSLCGGNITDSDMDFQIASTFTGISTGRSWACPPTAKAPNRPASRQCA